MGTFKQSDYEMPHGGFPWMAQRWSDYEVVLKPDRDEPEWWAGAPSVLLDEGVFWLACRMRTADAPRGLRGYEIRILRSEDGVRFETAHRIRREDVPIPGFERPALIKDTETGRFKLYGCAPVENQGWSVIKFEDAASPTEFLPGTAKVVIGGPAPEDDRDSRPREFKDPVLFHDGERYHCYVIGYLRRNERVYHFVSDDGEAWRPYANSSKAIMDLAGWHDFFVRPACVLPVGVGWLFIYEGSCAEWYDPVYNVATGVAFTFDLHNIIDLTPSAPLVMSSTPGKRFATWRYSHWMYVNGEVWVYAEVACPNETNEIRLFRLPLK